MEKDRGCLDTDNTCFSSDCWLYIYDYTDIIDKFISHVQSLRIIMLKDVRETAAWERHNGGFSVINVPAVIMSIDTFVNFQKNAERILGYDGAAVLLYETGKKSGEKWINRFSKEWKLKDLMFIDAVQNFYAELGWGKFDIKENNGKELIIRVENSFIARGYGKSNASVCHFLRGYNAGLAEVLKGRNLEACETRCDAKGDDCCEFVMQRVD